MSNAPPALSSSDEPDATSTEPACLRCGYDLRGVPDDAACPECGLLAERSRRPTDALRDARPKWLRSLSAGVWLMLLAVAFGVAWPVFMDPQYILPIVQYFVDYLSTLTPMYIMVWLLGPGGIAFASALFWAGAFLVTRPEFSPQRQKMAGGTRLRRAIRLLAAVPALGITVITGISLYQWINSTGGSNTATLASLAIAFVLAIVPLPVLLMALLRALAVRLGSPHLAEHCRIVGWLAAGAIVTGMCIIVLFENAEKLGLSPNFTEGGLAYLLAMLTAMTAMLLSALWFLYVMIRFALFFGRESRARRRAWRDADRSRPTPTTQTIP